MGLKSAIALVLIYSKIDKPVFWAMSETIGRAVGLRSREMEYRSDGILKIRV
jgi:hypothetical protein